MIKRKDDLNVQPANIEMNLCAELLFAHKLAYLCAKPNFSRLPANKSMA